MKSKTPKGLYQRWLEMELAEGKPLKQILFEINSACGTAYKHNWPSQMAARGYSIERTPDCVRRYMMRRVVPSVFLREKPFTPKEIETMIIRLT